MYLTVALLRAGLDVQCPKRGPDALLTIDSQRIWIEATCATAGVDGLPDSVPRPHYAKAGETTVATERPTDAMTLRIRNSLHFIDGSMPHISAVLGSREDAANRPRRLGDGLALFPNLSAANAWPAGSIPLGQEWIPTHLTVGDVDLEKHSYIEA
jgi:hypothetical protein